MFRAHRIVLFHPWCVQCVRVMSLRHVITHRLHRPTI